MRNYFTFDGVDSRSFGVYISGQGTFKAPARSYDAIEIPGRNGALLGIDSRLGNVELTYPAFIYSNFKENVAAFRAFLLSHKGYFKLKDSYHPDEFRLAYYPGPFEPDVTSANNAGSFDITFICKPQRYLESGEEVIELIPGQSETHTYTGNPASFVALGGDQITSLQIPLRFYQNLNGYDHPWPAGGGKNLLPLIDGTYALGSTGATAVVADGSITITGTTTAGGGRTTRLSSYFTLKAGTYIVSPIQNTTPYVRSYINKKSDGTALGYSNGNAITVAEDTEVYYGIGIESGQTYDITVKPQVEAGSTITTWVPYSNICPITGLTGLSVYVGPTQDPDDANVYNVVWLTQAGTVYHGTINPVSGQLTADTGYKKVSELSWSYSSGSFFSGQLHSGRAEVVACSDYKIVDYATPAADRTDFSINCGASESAGRRLYVKDSRYNGTTISDWQTAMADCQIVYKLATPVTYQLTATQIAALLAGETFVWSSNNEEVTVEVTFVIPTILENPTLFDALPLLRVYGTGILGIGNHTITITAADVYTDIDCEMMDCFKGSANKNQYVQFSGNDFPTLKPGVNGFSFSGITKVEVKPRWWSV